MAKTKVSQKKLISAICAILLLGYICYQGYMMVHKPVETETAYEHTINETIDADIFIVRDEKYLNNDSSGTIVPVIDDGKRVAKGEEVAIVFSSTSSAKNNTKIKELEDSLNRYKTLANQADNYTTDIDAVDKDIDNRQFEYLESISSGKYDTIKQSSDALRDKIVTRQMVTGTTIDFNSKIGSLEKSLADLKSQNSDYSSIYASQSGYYINNVDGFENSVAFKDVKSISVDQVNTLMKAKPANVPPNSIGKLVENFDWYMVCNVPSNRIGNLGVGDKITVVLPFASVSEVKAEVVSVNDANKDKIAVVLRSNYMDSNLANLRKESAELVFNKYKGLKIKPSAIRVNDKGQKGVYVKTGNMIKFKKVDVIYTDKNFVIVGNKENKSGYIELYDNVVIEGTDLYDRKVITR